MCFESGKSEVFVAIDGDHVGEALESFLVQRDLEGAQKFSQAVARLFQEYRQRLEQAGATIYICEGDSLLASVPDAQFAPDLLKDLATEPCSVSAGLGWDPRSAFLALKVAKALGRNQVHSLLDDDVLGKR